MEVEGEDTPEAEADKESPSCSSKDDDGDDRPVLPVDATVAGDGKLTSGVELESASIEIVPLHAEQADTLHQVKETIASEDESKKESAGREVYAWVRLADELLWRSHRPSFEA